MRKVMSTKKMTKKAMAMILTLSMVFGLAVTVYAEEEASEPVSEAKAAISEAKEAVSAVAPQGEVQVVEFRPIEAAVVDITNNLNTAETAVGNMVQTNEETGETVTDLQTADAANGVAAEQLALIDGEQLDTDTQNVKDALSAEGAMNDLGDFSAASKTAQEDAGKAISDAKTANTSKNRNEAYAAKDSAVANLANAKQGLKDATTAYNTASGKLDQAQDDYDAAVKAKKVADQKVQEAAAALENAQNNTTAALEALKAAKQNAANLAAQVQQYYDTKTDLEKMQKQYRALMVQYYKDLLGDNASYDADGKMNFDNCAATATATEAAIAATNAKADKPDDTVMRLSRNLMQQLVMYQLQNTEGVDVSTIQFAVGGSVSKPTKEGSTYVKDGKEQVQTKGTPNYTWYNQLVNTNDKTDPNGGGRTNRVKVVYTKKVDPETNEMVDKEITEYYNYIFKNSTRKDSLDDLAGGPIYLALINESAKTVNRDKDENCFDDYRTLTEAIDSIKYLDEYKAAKDAVDAAEAKVQALQNEIDALQGTLATNAGDLQDKTEKLTALEKALGDAKKDYEAAKADKAALKEKVEEAERAVAGINLSRFNVTVDDDSTPAGPVISSITPAVEVTPILPTIVPIASVSGGVAGVRTAAGDAAVPAGVDEVDAPAAGDGEAVTPVAQAPVTLEDEVLPGAAQATSLEDDFIPGAQTVEESVQLWWLWLLILLIAIVAFIIYRYNENRKKAETVEK